MAYSVCAYMERLVVLTSKVWLEPRELPGIIEKYRPEDVFNINETGLFYRQAVSELIKARAHNSYIRTCTCNLFLKSMLGTCMTFIWRGNGTHLNDIFKLFTA